MLSIKKRECNNNNNECNYLDETKDSLLERLMILDLLFNKSQDYDNLLKSDIIEKLKEYSKEYDKTQKSYIIQSTTYSRCLKETNKKIFNIIKIFLIIYKKN